MENSTILIDNIFQKNRFNRYAFLSYVDSKLDGIYKSEKIKFINKLEFEISEILSKHIKSCDLYEECNIEKVYDKALKILELRKEEVLSKKNFWENILSNPVGLGILIIGFANLIIAIVNILNSLGIIE